MLTSNIPNISEYDEFYWYEAVFYYDIVFSPNVKHKLAHWLGVAHHVGLALCLWLLVESGKVIARTTVQKINKDKLHNMALQHELMIFDQKLEAYFKDIYTVSTQDDEFNLYVHDI